LERVRRSASTEASTESGDTDDETAELLEASGVVLGTARFSGAISEARRSIERGCTDVWTDVWDCA
jgi:hypothetical protein